MARVRTEVEVNETCDPQTEIANRVGCRTIYDFYYKHCNDKERLRETYLRLQ